MDMFSSLSRNNYEALPEMEIILKTWQVSQENLENQMHLNTVSLNTLNQC